MKLSRLILTFFAAVLMATAVASCDKEETTQAIDPCPGWPAFKVGNEWTYLETSDAYPSGADTIYYMIDSILKINSKLYYRFIEFRENKNNMSIKHCLRCQGDSIILYKDSKEFILWIMDSKIIKDTFYIAIQYSSEGKTDTIGYVNTGTGNYYYNKITYNTQWFLYCPTSSYLPYGCYYTEISKEIGIIEEGPSGVLRSQILINFKQYGERDERN